MAEIKNGIIESTSLGELGRGFSSFVQIKHGSGSQGFGGYSVKDEYCYKWIKGVLDALKLDTWEELSGTKVRIKFGQSEHMGEIIVAIGHYMEDSWFEPRKDW